MLRMWGLQAVVIWFVCLFFAVFMSEVFFAVVATPVPVQLFFSGNILNPKTFLTSL